MLLALMALLTPMIKAPMASMLMGVIYILLFVGGVSCGIIGCCGIKAHGKQKILTPSIVGIALNILIPSLLIAIAIPSFSKARAMSLTKRMDVVVAEISKTTPVMIDNITRLDSVEMTDNRSLTYTHTIVTAEKSAIDVAEFIGAMQGVLQSQFMTLPQMEFFRNNGIKVTYTYLDRHAELITSIEISRDPQ